MKKTGSASAAAAIAMNGFKMEVLANASGGPCRCGRPEVTVGFTSVRTKVFDAYSITGADIKQGWLTGVFDPSNSDQQLENASIDLGFQGPNVPLNEHSHNGQTTFLDPATFDVTGPTFSDAIESPVGSGNYVFTATINVTRRNEKTKACPTYV